MRSFIRRIRDNLPLWSEQLPEMPGMLYEVLRETKHQQEKMRFEQATANLVANGKKNSMYKIGYFLSGAIVTLASVGAAVYFGVV